VRAAPVDYCRQRLQAKASARAILCNAGQANAATGAQGWLDALKSAMLLGQALNIPGESILLASTGVIGKRIPMDILRRGIPQLVAAASETGSDAAAQAIVTTDLRLNEPRYASLPNIMKAKKKPIAETSPETLGVDVAPRLKVLKTTEPGGRKAGVKVVSVADLVERLKNEAAVL